MTPRTEDEVEKWKMSKQQHQQLEEIHLHSPAGKPLWAPASPLPFSHPYPLTSYLGPQAGLGVGPFLRAAV